MTYAESVAYLYSLQKHGIKLGLETMTALVSRLDMPQIRYPTLHIAGTNGKGSTAAMTAAILQAAGYRVGLYTSPHLIEFRERIRVNGEMIAEAAVARLTEQLRALCQPDLSPTFFECTTAMAFQHFADAKVDIAVMEVGLGGRFDATNMVIPLACTITTIALDHQEYLGTTLSSVAFEKAGIIKPQVPVIVGRVPGEAFHTIERVALEGGASLRRLGREFRVRGWTPECFSFTGSTLQVDDLHCTLQGLHQIDNAACALALLESAASGGVAITEKAVREGLSNVRWEGRIEIVDREPMVVLDGAHNPAAAAALAEYLCASRLSRPGRRIILVLGMMRDKDHRGFVEPLNDLVDEVVLTQADLPRSATAQELRAKIGDCWPHAFVKEVLSDALAQARGLAGADDLICITGSLMLIGDVKALFRGCELSPIRG
ncbi:MAG TPA: folylpolyglutamate synthase/dihydrofolate synthase family protein [Nitrospira sp.]|nr:folylpolyglutamate synthase/dihydrofolate synthase family protein [Nitrospira sp.]